MRMNTQYDYLIVGAGLFGCVFAYEASRRNKSCLVIDRRNHVGGNMYTEDIKGIHVHKYGAHIFHTSNQSIWDYINQFAEFKPFINSPIACYRNKLYNLPFNMNTFYSLWGTKTPYEAKSRISSEIKKNYTKHPKNLKEQAINMVGTDIYEKFIRGYTAKQWGKNPEDLPASIIKRIPVRFTFDNNYFNDTYQGIPIGGYTQIAEKMLEKADVILNTEYSDYIKKYNISAKKLVYTGSIDEFYNYRFGRLDYRNVKFEIKILPVENYQGNAVINYTDIDIPYTRIIEHKHFDTVSSDKTVISLEYPFQNDNTVERFYPINDKKNSELLAKYQDLSCREDKIIFGGRLGQYKYYDMHQIIAEALKCAKEEFGERSS